MTVKGERYEIEDLKFVLANTSVKNMHLLGVEEEKIPGAVEMWVANEEKNIDMIRIFDGIEELLEKLEKKGSTLGVVTSRTREELELVLDQLPIRKYFSICICADDTKEHKPSAQPLLKYMELSGARKEETVYIGDSASDMAIRFIESQRRICYDDREINFIVKKHVNKIKWKRKGEEYEDRNRK